VSALLYLPAIPILARVVDADVVLASQHRNQSAQLESAPA